MDDSNCPFCGSMNIFLAEFDLELGWGILCLDCQASGPQCSTKEEAYDKWHDRWVPEIDVNGNTVKTIVVGH